MPEFVVDLPCTSRVWEVEYPEFVIRQNSMKSLAKMRPKGLRARRVKK